MITTPSQRVHSGDTRWDFDDALHHVRCYAPAADDIQREIAQTMVDLDCGTWHASWLVHRARLEDGRTPTDVCSLCGGRNRAGEGDHNMCTARARRDRPTPRLDIVDSYVCDCHPCTQAREGR